MTGVLSWLAGIVWC